MTDKFLSSALFRNVAELAEEYDGGNPDRVKRVVAEAIATAGSMPKPEWSRSSNNGDEEWTWYTSSTIIMRAWQLRNGRWVAHAHAPQSHNSFVRITTTSGEAKEKLEAFLLWQTSHATVAA